MTAIDSRATIGPSWDPIVRITHWGVALAIVLNGLINEGGSTLHIWIGYSALALLVLRLLWGVIGPEEARFSSFPPTISGAIGHLREVLVGRHRSYRSHNPAGGLMVYALWGMLALTAATGVVLETEPFPAETTFGAVAHVEHRETAEHREAGDHDEEDEAMETVEEIHELAANLLLILAGLHVAGVALESRLSGRNLVRAMIRGKPTGRSGE